MQPVGSYRRIRSRGVLLLFGLLIGLIPSLAIPRHALATSYASTIEADSPGIFYQLGESSGTTATDSSGNAHNGTYTSYATLGQTGPLIGDSTTAVHQTSGNSVTYTGGSGLPTGNSNRSIEVWFKTTSTAADQNLAEYGSAGSATGFGVEVVGANSISIDDWSTSKVFNTPHAVRDGYWHYVVATWDGTNYGMYVDGANLGTSNPGYTLSTTSTKLTVGDFVDAPDSPLIGTLGEFAVYPTVLTSTQVSSHFSASGNGVPAAPASVTATAGQNAAHVTWPASTGGGVKGGDAVSGYTVVAYDGTTAVQTVSVGNTLAATVSGLKGGTAYTFRASAWNLYGTSGTTTSGSVTPVGASSTYVSAVEGDSPFAFYRLGEVTGSVSYDSTSNGLNAGNSSWTKTSPVGPLVTDPVAGMTGGSLGGGPRVYNPAGVPTGNSSKSIEGWFRGTSAPVTVAAWGTAGGHSSFELDMPDATHLQVDDWTSGASWTVSNLFDGNWHYIAGTWDGTHAVAYLDGTSLGSITVGTNEATTGDYLYIGSAASDTSTGAWPLPASDKEADVAMYSGVLSSTQVTNHWNAAQLDGGPLTPAQHSPGGGRAVGPCAGGTVQSNSTNTPINTATGDFWHTFTDIAIPGRSCPLQFTQTYSAQAAAAGTTGALGYGWTDNYGMSLAVTGTSPNQIATVINEDASQATFNQPASGSSWAASAPRFIATLTYNSGSSTWTYVKQGQWTYTFNISGQLTSKVDLNGYTTSYTYTSGNLTTVTDPAGRTLTINWTSGKISSVVDANVSGNTRTVSFTYNGSGELSDITDVNGGDTHFTYDTSHRMTVMKDPVCQAAGTSCPGVQNTTYDSSNRVTVQKDQLNRETDLDYTSIPGATKTTDPAGHVKVDYYSQGLRIATTMGYGTSSAATTTFSYDPSTLAMTSVTDPNGNTATMTYDSNGNMLTRTDPLGHTTTFTYNALNEPLTVKDPNGVTTTNTYDGNGNLATTSTPVSGSSCPCQVVTYNHADSTHPGDVTSVVDPDSKTTSFGFDTYGNKVEVKDPLGNVSASVFNADGWVTATYAPKASCTWGSTPPTGCSSTYKTTYSYIISGTTVDEFGDVQTITDPLSHVATYGYDADRHKTSIQDANSNTTTNRYDYAGQLCWTLPGGTSTNACSTPPANARVTDYNSDGTVSDQKDGKGNAILTYGYDSLARVIAVTDALSNVTTYTYDLAGNQLTKKDPVTGATCTGTKVGCTTMTYNAGNQLTSITYSDGVTPNVTGITYDADSQRTAMTDGTGTSTWTWDNLHRLSSYQNGNSQTVAYTYNLRNLPTTITYPGSHSVTRGYDDASRLTSVQDWLATPNTSTFAYDANSNLTIDTLANGVTDTYTLNAANQMTAISDVKGTTIFAATYTRDSNGQLASDNSQATNQGSYKYTALNQLCYAGSSSSSACSAPPTSSYPYAFDNADNLTTNNGTAQQYNNADQLCWSVSGASSNACGTAPTGATAYNFDTRGNRTTQVPGSGSATCDTYDQANRLAKIQTGTGSSCTTPTTVSTYAYDGSGLRQSKAVTGTTTQFTWDPSGGMPQLLQEKSGAASPTSYIYGPGGLPLEQIDPSGTAHFYSHDQIGSTRALSSAAGVAEDAWTFDPYGNVASSSGTVANHLQFSGQYVDAESGLYYFRARYYDPVTGQFLSVDPMVAKTRSPYGYGLGNPITNVDPLGLYSYSYSYDLGSIQDKGSAASAMRFIQRMPNETYPFAVINDDGPNEILLCAKYHLPGAIVPWHDEPVQATAVSNTSFSFTALPGHLEGTGAVITFSTTEQDGHVWFTIAATGPDSPVEPVWQAIRYGGTHMAWNQFASNLSNALPSYAAP